MIYSLFTFHKFNLGVVRQFCEMSAGSAILADLNFKVVRDMINIVSILQTSIDMLDDFDILLQNTYLSYPVSGQRIFLTQSGHSLRTCLQFCE